MSDTKKIQAIIGHLASEHEGEVIAAARALKRMADAKGKKLWEFLVVKEEAVDSWEERQRKASEKRTAANESSYGFHGFGFNYYHEQARKEREARQKHAEEQARKERERKEAAKKKATEDIYEEMKNYKFRAGFDSDPFDIYEKLKEEWIKEPSNWHDLRDKLAMAVTKKGSDHLTTWEKEFLLDIFTWTNLSPNQRKLTERIARERYGLNI